MSNIISEFIKKEDKHFIEFLANFEIIGLTLASIIGLSITALSKTFTEEIIMPFIEPLISMYDWKNYRVQIGNADLGIGLFTSDFINLLLIALTMFIVYSFFKYYLSDVIDNKSLWRNQIIELEKTNNNELNNIHSELKELKDVLIAEHKKKKQNEI